MMSTPDPLVKRCYCPGPWHDAVLAKYNKACAEGKGQAVLREMGFQFEMTPIAIIMAMNWTAQPERTGPCPF